VPILSGRQVQDFLDGRNGSFFSNLNWNAASQTLSFSVTTAATANGLQAMLPVQSAVAPLTSITQNGAAVSFTTQTIKGVQYAFFNTSGGNYVAQYGTVTSPTVTGQTPAANSTNVVTTTPIKATFNESVLASSISLTLKDGSGNAVAGTVAYDNTTF